MVGRGSELAARGAKRAPSAVVGSVDMRFSLVSVRHTTMDVVASLLEGQERAAGDAVGTG